VNTKYLVFRNGKSKGKPFNTEAAKYAEGTEEIYDFGLANCQSLFANC